MNQTTKALCVGAEKGPEGVVAFLENLRGKKLPAELRQRFLSNDYNALYACQVEDPIDELEYFSIEDPIPELLSSTILSDQKDVLSIESIMCN